MRAISSLIALAVVGCRGAAPVHAGTGDPAASAPTASSPATGPAAPKKLGGLTVVADESQGHFRLHRLGAKLVLEKETSFFELDGERLVPIPDFLRGGPSFDPFLMTSDKAFEHSQPPAGDARTWEGRRNLIALRGEWPSATWLVAERGDYQMYLGEAWTHGERGWTKRADGRRVPWVFDHSSAWRDGSLLVITEPYAGNDWNQPKGESRDMFQLEAFAASGKAPVPPRMHPAPKGCLSSIDPGGVLAWPTGEVVVWGSPCSNQSEHIAVEWWPSGANAGKMGKLERLPEGKGAHSFRVIGVQASGPRDVWLAAEDTGQSDDGRPYVAHFDGVHWAIVPLDRALKKLDHVALSTDGTVSFIDWPSAVWRVGPSHEWIRRSLAPSLGREEFSVTEIWGGASTDLWVVGKSKPTDSETLLHAKP